MSDITTGIWVFWVAYCLLGLFGFGYKGILAGVIGFFGYLVLWHFCPQLGPWEALGVDGLISLFYGSMHFLLTRNKRRY